MKQVIRSKKKKLLPRRERKPRAALKNIEAPFVEAWATTIYSIECPHCDCVLDFNSRPSHGLEFQCVYCDGMMTIDMSAA